MTARRLAARVPIARLVLWVEAVAPPLVLAATIPGAVAAAGLFDLPTRLPGWLHALTLALAALAMARILRPLASGRLAWPDRAAALRRIERDSGLSHRPLAALEDTRALGDPALWAAHRARLVAGLGALSLSGPRLGLAAADPAALRMAVLLCLIAGLVIAGPDGPNRIARAFSPSLGAPLAPPVLEAWITPPKATGRPPLFLTRPGGGAATGRADDAFVVPENSEVTLRIKGAERVDLTLGDQRVQGRGAREATQELKGVLTRDVVVAASGDGRTLARWPVRVIPDSAPEVAWTDHPAVTPRGVLRLAYRARDQYGIAAMALLIARAAETGAKDEGATQSVDLPLPPRGGTGDQTAFRDLTAHPWAGLDVILRVEATNLQGRAATSAPLAFTLPERVFNHPVARQIVAERKTLARQPALALRVARALSALTERPEAFGDDMTAFLALRAAVHRLVEADGRLPEGIFDLLWDVALRIEDGNLAGAAQALRAAQERLEQALAENKPQAEIERLMRELRGAMDDYLRSVLAEGQGDGARRAPPSGGRSVSPRDLQALLDQARELSRAGNRDAARQLLNMLQSMLEGLKGGAGAPGEDPGEASTAEAMGKLGELMGRQQRLMDRTLREGQSGPRGLGPGGSAQPGLDPGIQAEQQALRRDLNQILEGMEGAGELPQGFADADRAMREAEGALGAKRPQDATGPQADALRALRDGAKALGDKLLANQNRRGGGQGGRGAAGRDPLGRPGPSTDADDGEGVTVPDQGEIERAREIMDELRRRAGERQRPKPELDYLDRLLERF